VDDISLWNIPFLDCKIEDESSDHLRQQSNNAVEWPDVDENFRKDFQLKPKEFYKVSSLDLQ
jgi:hypothetical protein